MLPSVPTAAQHQPGFGAAQQQQQLPVVHAQAVALDMERGVGAAPQRAVRPRVSSVTGTVRPRDETRRGAPGSIHATVMRELREDDCACCACNIHDPQAADRKQAPPAWALWRGLVGLAVALSYAAVMLAIFLAKMVLFLPICALWLVGWVLANGVQKCCCDAEHKAGDLSLEQRSRAAWDQWFEASCTVPVIAALQRPWVLGWVVSSCLCFEECDQCTSCDTSFDCGCFDCGGCCKACLGCCGLCQCLQECDKACAKCCECKCCQADCCRCDIKLPSCDCDAEKCCSCSDEPEVRSVVDFLCCEFVACFFPFKCCCIPGCIPLPGPVCCTWPKPKC